MLSRRLCRNFLRREIPFLCRSMTSKRIDTMRVVAMIPAMIPPNDARDREIVADVVLEASVADGFADGKVLSDGGDVALVVGVVVVDEKVEEVGLLLSCVDPDRSTSTLKGIVTMDFIRGQI